MKQLCWGHSPLSRPVHIPTIGDTTDSDTMTKDMSYSQYQRGQTSSVGSVRTMKQLCWVDSSPSRPVYFSSIGDTTDSDMMTKEIYSQYQRGQTSSVGSVRMMKQLC